MALSNVENFNYSDMRFLGTLQKNVPVSDGSGCETDNWVNVLTARCAMEVQNGRLRNGLGKMEYQKSYRLVCRCQIAIQPDPDYRWLINNEVYKVENYNQVDLTAFMYEFTVYKNQVSAGV